MQRLLPELEGSQLTGTGPFAKRAIRVPASTVRPARPRAFRVQTWSRARIYSSRGAAREQSHRVVCSGFFPIGLLCCQSGRTALVIGQLQATSEDTCEGPGRSQPESPPKVSKIGVREISPHPHRHLPWPDDLITTGLMTSSLGAFHSVDILNLQFRLKL